VIKKIMLVVKTLLILVIVLICGLMVLQDRIIFGYQAIEITSSYNSLLEKGDVVLTKGKSVYEQGDVVVYRLNEEVNISLVDLVFSSDGMLKLKNNELILKEQICGEYKYKFLVLGFIYDIISSKMGFAIGVLIPFLMLVIIEVIDIFKKKKDAVVIDDEVFPFENQEIVIEKEILSNEKFKKRIKKEKDLDQTIQISLDKIKKEIDNSSDKKDLEDTLVLFGENDIKEEIKKELEKRKEE